MEARGVCAPNRGGAAPRLGRLQGVQALRGLAITLIFISHCNYLKNDLGGTLLNFAGAAGVSIFFILSGFLVMRSRLAKSDRKVGLLSGVKRRLGKIYPLHIATLCAAVPLALLGGAGVLSLGVKAIAQVLLIQSWIPLPSVYYSLNTPAWYLSTYVFLIVAAPFLAQVVLRFAHSANFKKSLIMVLVGVFVFEGALASLPLSVEQGRWFVYICPVVRMLDFAAGMVLFLVTRERSVARNSLFFWVGSILLVFGVAITVIFPMPKLTYFTALWYAPALLLVAATGGALGEARMPAILRSELLVWMGNISMQLFLTHWLVIRYAGLVFDLGKYPIISTLVLFGFSILIAWLIAQIPRFRKLAGSISWGQKSR